MWLGFGLKNKHSMLIFYYFYFNFFFFFNFLKKSNSIKQHFTPFEFISNILLSFEIFVLHQASI